MGQRPWNPRAPRLHGLDRPRARGVRCARIDRTYYFVRTTPLRAGVSIGRHLRHSLHEGKLAGLCGMGLRVARACLVTR